MSYGTVQAEKMTTESGYSLGAGNASSFKNRIINGGMVIDQRNAGALVNPAVNGAYSLDRWVPSSATSSVFSIQQSTTAPAGFNNSLLITSLASTSVTTNLFYSVQQIIEGFNIADLGFGTANAKAITLSFWVRSSLTGTFSGCVQNGNVDRSYPFTYTISSANTWTQASITITGDTTGTWSTTNTAGMFVLFSLGMGSARQGTANAWNSFNARAVSGETQVVATSGATWQVTGVQVEIGTVATSWDFRSYGTEMQLCQRYYQKTYNYAVRPGTAISANSGIQTSFGTAGSGIVGNAVVFPVVMRTDPTLTVYDNAGNSARVTIYDTGATTTDNVALNTSNAIESRMMVRIFGVSCAGLSFVYTVSAEL
jgi:hypothetical protein